MNKKNSYKVTITIEGTRVTGPLRNVLQFCNDARTPPAPFDFSLDAGICTFFRGKENDTNEFLSEVKRRELRLSVIHETRAFELSLIKKFKHLLAKETPDLIQTHGIKSHFVMSLSGMKGHIPWIAYHHGYTYTDTKMHLYNRLDRFSLPRATHVITVCDFFKQDLVKRRGVRPENISVIMNAISPGYTSKVTEASMQKVRRRLGISEATKLVVAVGRFSREKGQLDLVRAWKKCVAQLKEPTVLAFIGEGPDESLVKKEVATLEIGDSVIFGGHWSSHIIPDLLSTASLMVLPSHTEGCPNVLLEAMMSKTPSIATRVGGVPEIVSHEEDAFLVPPHDPDALEQALTHMLGNKDLLSSFAEKGFKKALTTFSPEERQKNIFTVYNSILHNQRLA